MIKECTDEELVYMIHANSDIALTTLLDRVCEAVLSTIEGIIKRLGCYEVEDAKQAVRLGCLSAVDTFRPDKDSSFRYFAKMCAEREVRSMVRKERSKGLSSHYRSVSLDQVQVRESEGIYLVDTIENHYPEYNPTWCIEKSNAEYMLNEYMQMLNEMERKICYLRLEGYSYKEIAKLLDMSCKCVDNTVQRVRRKLQRRFD